MVCSKPRNKEGSDRRSDSTVSTNIILTYTHVFLVTRQVSETANPRLVQPRHAAVQLRSRRNEFGRRREAEAGLMTRLARNAGVICRQANIAEAKKTGRERCVRRHLPGLSGRSDDISSILLEENTGQRRRAQGAVT